MPCASMNRSFLFVLVCLSIWSCSRDLPPAEVVKKYEDDVSHGNGSGAKDLLTAEQAKGAHDLFSAVAAEARNRREEGVVTEQRSTQMTGGSARVIAVYVMQDQVKRTYTWELVREHDRWRISTWAIEVSAGK